MIDSRRGPPGEGRHPSNDVCSKALGFLGTEDGTKVVLAPGGLGIPGLDEGHWDMQVGLLTGNAEAISLRPKVMINCMIKATTSPRRQT